MAPFCLQKSIKIAPKTDSKRHQTFDRFLLRFSLHFGSVLGTKLGPCWPLFRSKCGSAKGTRPFSCWVYVLFNFFRRSDPILDPFWRLWTPSGLDFEGVWTHFGPKLALCWAFLAQELAMDGPSDAYSQRMLRFTYIDYSVVKHQETS